MAPTVTALVNQKGGVAKSTSCINLGAALVQEGQRVLLVDTDPQASMTIALGNPQPDNLPVTLADLMAKVMNDQHPSPGEGIIHHPECFAYSKLIFQVIGIINLLVIHRIKSS